MINRRGVLIGSGGIALACSAWVRAATTLVPAPGAAGVCPDTLLRIESDTPLMAADHGTVRVCDASDDHVAASIDLSQKTASQAIGGVPGFKYTPVIADGNKVWLALPNHALAYGKTYYVQADAGVFGDAAPGGLTDKSWRFSTRNAPPVAGSVALFVAADGSGDFSTVQGALDFVPDGNTTRTTITIKSGTYPELICFTNKNAITVHGQDRHGTVIRYANNNKFNTTSEGHLYHRGVFIAGHCSGLTIENLTIRNTTPQGGSQAEALILAGNTKAQATVRGVDLFSYQDTLQINGQAYVSNLHVEGDVDFLWGNGPCFFERCEFVALRSGAYYAQVRNPPTNHGYVFDHCTFTGPEKVKNVYLDRIAPATYPATEVVLLDCVLGPAVNPVAWLLNGVKGAPPEQALAAGANEHFWEFDSHAADGSPIDASKRLSISKQLALPADAATIHQYQDPAFVLGNDWHPGGAATQP